MKHKIDFLGFRGDEGFPFRGDKAWPHYAWRVTIGDEAFGYNTGVGNATRFYSKTEKRNDKPSGSIAVSARGEWAHTPKIDEILGCLFSDAEAGSMSFNEFCDNLGYSNDSLKALDTYRACMETAPRLRKALGGEYAATAERIAAMRERGEI